MRITSTLFLGTVLLSIVACAPKQAPNTVPVTTTSTRNAPTWIDNEEISDGLGAVGIAPSNAMGDKSLQRTVAIADARTKLAGKIKVRVQNVFFRLDQQVAGAAADGATKPIKTDAMNRVIEVVSRQVIEQELVGTNTRGVWTDPADGNLYVFVIQTKDSLDRAMAGAAKKAINQEIAQGEMSLDKALSKLDAAIAATDARSENSKYVALDKLNPTAPVRN